MKLTELSYSEFVGQPREWIVDQTQFDSKNLIVGKNATGKSRFLSVITGLSNLLSGDQVQLFDEGNYNVKFDNLGMIYQYELTIQNRVVTYEKLYKNGNLEFERDITGTGVIYAEEIKQLMKFQIPLNQIVIQAKRDQIQHPFLEDLISWGKKLRFFSFGTNLGKDQALLINNPNQEIIGPKNTAQPIVVFDIGRKKFGQEYIDNILIDMNNIGYKIKEIDIGIHPSNTFSSPGNPVGLLLVKEKDLLGYTYQTEMSQGMFRALSIIIQINYLLLEKSSSTILIDDIGEGIDFDRSVKLIDILLSERLYERNQIFLSSNDKFVMNTVPIENWQVMSRDGTKCKFYNKFNSKQIFADFNDVGLSNFDFFSSEFYSKGLSEE